MIYSFALNALLFSGPLQMRHLTACRWALCAPLRLTFLIGLCLTVGCARRPVLVITVGGLGFSQMGSVRQAIQKQCPQAEVRSAGAWDAYKAELPRMIRDTPHEHLVLIGHSLGCQTVAEAAGKAPKLDLLVLIEPAWDDIRIPKGVKRCLWYQRSNFDFVRPAKVHGISPIKINGGHNDVTHSSTLISSVVKAINDIEIKRDRRK